MEASATGGSERLPAPRWALGGAAAIVLLGLLGGPAADAEVPGQIQIHGTVTAFDGRFDLHVQLAGGEVDAVRLHKGTIINPTGLTLAAGMRVTVLGLMRDGVLDATEIDTPYHRVDWPYPPYGPYLSPYPFGPYPVWYPYGDGTGLGGSVWIGPPLRRAL